MWGLHHVHTIHSALHDQSCSTECSILARWINYIVCKIIHCTLSSLIVAARFSVTKFLKKHEDDFFKYVNPRQSLLRLKRKGVITEDVKSSIDGSNTKDALEYLYDHLKCYGNLHTLREYCKMAIDAEGFPNMQALGRKMMKELPTEVGIACLARVSGP